MARTKKTANNAEHTLRNQLRVNGFVTRATGREYGEFFSLYSKFHRLAQKEGACSLLGGLSGEEEGVYFLPLGYIPGEAVILRFKEGKVELVDATRATKASVVPPSSPVEPEVLPGPVLGFLEETRELCEGLGEPSPFYKGLAQALLFGNPPEGLIIGFLRFRFGNEDPETPFGVSLSIEWGGMRVDRVYNPGNLEAPKEGEIIPLDEIQGGGKTPFHKLIRLQAKLESAARKAIRADRNNKKPA